MKKELLEKYFAFNDFFFEENDVIDNLTEEFVLLGDKHFNQKGIEVSNVYFKLLAQLYYLLSKENISNSVLGHMHYIIAYYVGLFLHPIQGDFLALLHIDEAMKLETDKKIIEKYKILISMIKEEI